MQLDTHFQNSEQAELAAIKANDNKALEAFYQRCFPKVEKFIRENNGSAEEAKDIFQEAFIAVWRNVQLGKFVSQNDNALDGYLFQVARNKWIDFLRSGYHQHTVKFPGDGQTFNLPELLPEDEHIYINDLKQVFKNLGDNCKNVLTRFYYQNESLKTIAAAMNWTEPTARNNKYRCIERLREMLKQK